MICLETSNCAGRISQNLQHVQDMLLLPTKYEAREGK